MAVDAQDLTTARQGVTILMADDDLGDCQLTRKAFSSSRVLNDLRFVHDGEQLLRYLRRQEEYQDPDASPRPGIILLDLNMPRMDGREALKAIKSDPDLRRIPVVVLTTSKAEEDIYRSYDLGANSYITKPVKYADLVEAMRTVDSFWFRVVTLPPERYPGP